MFGLVHDPQLRMHLTVIDSDEVRAAKGYRETRERAHADRERSLVEILRRGRDDGSFPLADPRARRDSHQRRGQPRDGRMHRPVTTERCSESLARYWISRCVRSALTGDEFRGVRRCRYPKAPPDEEEPNAVDHAVALVRQQPRGSRAVLHVDLPELVDREVQPLHRDRAR